MTSHITAMAPTPEEVERLHREFQERPAMDPVRARWLDEHRPDWRDPLLSREALSERIAAARDCRRCPWR